MEVEMSYEVAGNVMLYTAPAPINVTDTATGHNYESVSYLGDGFFSKCYKVVNKDTGELSAMKVTPKKAGLNKHKSFDIFMEIRLLKALSHDNIIKFKTYFESQTDIYMILELCERQTMDELLVRRITLTDYECRYYTHYIIQAVRYLHSKHIIHCDLKLGNVFLNDRLQVKIGDFNLSRRILFKGEKKKGIVGTIDYIAPELLYQFQKHSYEIDIWAIGCIMYIILVGKAPFLAPSKRETYAKILKGDYHIPEYVNRQASDVIVAILQKKPETRPSIKGLSKFLFFTCVEIPQYLPSCYLYDFKKSKSKSMIL